MAHGRQAEKGDGMRAGKQYIVKDKFKKYDAA
jgi:hypothetical protein